MTTVSGILRHNASLWPDKQALVATRNGRDTALTFSELEAAANAFAARLTKDGIRRRDPVLVFVPMSVPLYVVLLGIFRIGATAMFLDPTSGIRHINACCEKLPPAALVSVALLRLARPFVRGLRKIPRVYSLSGAYASAVEMPPFPEPDDPALITFTSGSTGKPKAAVRTHRFLIAQHEALKSSIELEEGERDLTTLPIFVLANLASGVTSILPDAKISHPGSVDASKIERQVARLRPTRTGGSPAFYSRLAAAPASLAGFRKIYTGGAPVFPSVLRKIQSLAPDADVVAVYGSTEAEPIAHAVCRKISEADWQAMQEGKGLLAGKPIAQIQLRVVRDQWGAELREHLPLAAGEIGEVVVTGEHVLKGYLNGEGDAETKVTIDGDIWHRTGDAGYLDEAGRLWLLGRCSARVHDGHGTLYPFAAECVAMTYPFVRRCAFVLSKGRRLLAVEGNESLSDKDLEDLWHALAWAHVDEVRPLQKIPVDARHNSKVNYPKLEKLLRKLS